MLHQKTSTVIWNTCMAWCSSNALHWEGKAPCPTRPGTDPPRSGICRDCCCCPGSLLVYWSSPKLWFPPPQTPYSPTAPGTGVQPWPWKPGHLQEPYSGSDNPGQHPLHQSPESSYREISDAACVSWPSLGLVEQRWCGSRFLSFPPCWFVHLEFCWSICDLNKHTKTYLTVLLSVSNENTLPLTIKQMLPRGGLRGL